MSYAKMFDLEGAAKIIQNYKEEKFDAILRVFESTEHNWQVRSVSNEIQHCQDYINGILHSLKRFETVDRFPQNITNPEKLEPYLLSEATISCGREDVENMARLLTILEEHTEAIRSGHTICLARTYCRDIKEFSFIYARSEKEAVDRLFSRYGIKIPAQRQTPAHEEPGAKAR